MGKEEIYQEQLEQLPVLFIVEVGDEHKLQILDPFPSPCHVEDQGHPDVPELLEVSCHVDHNDDQSNEIERKL